MPGLPVPRWTRTGPVRPVPSTGERIAPLTATMLGSSCAKRRSGLGLTTNQPATTIDVLCLCQSGYPNMLHSSPLDVYWRGQSHGPAWDVADSRGGSTCSVAVLPPEVAKGSTSTVLTQGKRKVTIRAARLCTKRSRSPKQTAGRGGGIQLRFPAAVALSRCRRGTPRDVPGRVVGVFSGRGAAGAGLWKRRAVLADAEKQGASWRLRSSVILTCLKQCPATPRAAGCGIPKNLVASCVLPTFAGSAASYILRPRGLEL